MGRRPTLSDPMIHAVCELFLRRRDRETGKSWNAATIAELSNKVLELLLNQTGSDGTL